jgi:NAD(P)-dependent dehydrogenase (short-subunit alcohol dehydrogenase family)/malonyl CoA-acyl carrier protein transacylase/acyl carrier protein
VETRRVHIAVAGHSALVDPILDEFTSFTRTLSLHAPTIPYISNVSGTWIKEQEATDPQYWARHLRHTVCFADGMRTLLETPGRILLEVGPGRGLSSLAKQYLMKGDGHSTFASTRHRQDKQPDTAFLLTTLGRLWLSGSTVDWAALYAHERRRHISLPTYPFERQRFWVEQSTSGMVTDEHQRALSKKPDIADWFYVPAWRRLRLVKPAMHHEPVDHQGCWVVFADSLGVGAQIAQRMAQAGRDVVTVTVGEQFAMVDRDSYTINPQQRADYDALFHTLATHDRVPTMIVHLWGVTTSDGSTQEVERVAYEQYLGFYSLIFLAQALSDQNITEPIQISVVTDNMQDVIGDERLCPGKTTVLAPCKVIPREYPHITCRSIDVVLADPGARSVEKIVDQLILELAALPSDTIVAYRGTHRWVEAFQPISLEQQDRLPLRLRDRGVYVITGGLGGIGLELAEYLAQTLQARLVLIDRLTFPQPDEWTQWCATHDQHDDISRKIARLERIEQLGAEVLVITADVADQQQMSHALARTLDRFGTIHGVVHGAGVAHGGMIQLLTPDLAARVLTPKLTGTLVLTDLLQDIDLDFLALFSSVSSILGDFGQVDYCASNLFLDAFARTYAARTGTFTVSINWDAWQGVGMAVEAAGPQDIKELRERSLETAILPQEGVEAFVRALSDTAPQIIVSTRNFEVVVEQYRRYNVTSALEELEQVRQLQVAHPRPAQRSAYVRPRDAVEEIIAEIWQDLLGIEQVGVHDDFLELGGHSLLATQVIARVRDAFQVNLPLASIFETPTVAGLAVTLLQHESEPGQVITIARLRQQINAMSAEEIRSVLEGQA